MSNPISNNVINNTLSNTLSNTMNNAVNNAVNNTVNNINSNNVVEHSIASNIYLLTLFIFLACLGFIMFYFLSEQFRVYKTLTYMKIYSNFQSLTSMEFNNDTKNLKLSNFLVASSFNSAHSGFQILDYVSLDMILANLRSGARFLEFTIFNDKFGNDAEPLISNGYHVGEWKLTANTLPFKDACIFIKNNAFKVSNDIGGVYNPKDPLFISLNLKVNYSTKTLDKIHEIIYKNFINRLLPSKYSYSKRNIGEIPLSQLMGKVIILSTDGYQGSKLEELVNYTWDKTDIKRIHFNNIENEKDLVNHNRTKLTMVYPHNEGDIMTTNYDPNSAWRYGCQFVAMNFQKVDTHMDAYITKFKNKSFIPKPPSMR